MHYKSKHTDNSSLSYSKVLKLSVTIVASLLLVITIFNSIYSAISDKKAIERRETYEAKNTTRVYSSVTVEPIINTENIDTSSEQTPFEEKIFSIVMDSRVLSVYDIMDTVDTQYTHVDSTLTYGKLFNELTGGKITYRVTENMNTPGEYILCVGYVNTKGVSTLVSFSVEPELELFTIYELIVVEGDKYEESLCTCIDKSVLGVSDCLTQEGVPDEWRYVSIMELVNRMFKLQIPEYFQ